jgi:hypothetical protein
VAQGGDCALFSPFSKERHLLLACLRRQWLSNLAPMRLPVSPHRCKRIGLKARVGKDGDGYHARSALGFAQLPTGAAVEVEAIFEIKS